MTTCRFDSQKATTVACCVVITSLLAVKVFLIWRLNINWDEFYYLSKIHQAARDDQATAFQSVYTHAFRWIIGVDGEIGQIRAARLIMALLLAATVALIFVLASRWVKGAPAYIAPLTYLSFEYVQIHGGSFRADSLLSPLLLATFVFCSAPRRQVGITILSGFFFGLSLLASLKGALALPIALWLLLMAPRDNQARWRLLLPFAASSVATFAVGLSAHLSALDSATFSDFIALAQSSAHKVLASPPPELRYKYFWTSLRSDGFAWALCLAGLLFSVRDKRFSLAALFLSVSPVFFYRNSFPYYYVVMLAPASVLASYATARIVEYMHRASRSCTATVVPFSIAALLTVNAAQRVSVLSEDRQSVQASLVRAVHHIFPKPVPYVDHSGMIASFRKTNFFMSTWGLDANDARTFSFMSRAINERTIMLLANKAVLTPGTNSFERNLSFMDQMLIQKYYVPYWGSIFVAGRHIELGGPDEQLVSFPFDGRYRNLSAKPIHVNGKIVLQGETFEVKDSQAKISPLGEESLPLQVRMVWSDARLPPKKPPPHGQIYDRFDLY